MKKSSVILFLDFDGVYKSTIPPENYYVLTNDYSNDTSINVNKFDCREKAYFEFEKYCRLVEESVGKKNINISLYKMILFNSFFYPLSRWIFYINELREKFIFDKIIFSSKSNFSKIFLLEAEGERNSQFLYKNSFFLSFYLWKFLKNEGYNIRYNRTHNIVPRICFFLRGKIILFLKFFQLFFYKIFTIKRSFNVKSDLKKKIIFSTRGIIQSFFIQNLYKLKSDDMLIIVNEASSLPFKNFKFAKANFSSFFYAEGNLKIKDLLKRLRESKVFSVIKFGNIEDFMGIEIRLDDLIPEAMIYDFHMKTYADSLQNSLNYLNITDPPKIISFEMLNPFSYYVKKMTKSKVVQIQTTLMAQHKNPDFVYSDKFYFYNKDVYLGHSKVNDHIRENFDYIDNIKYAGINPVEVKNKIEKIIYFSQPIYLEEEQNIIELLHNFCVKNNINLYIKLHPRSKKSHFSQWSKCNIIDGEVNPLDVIMKSDLVVTRTSSIGLDCWYANVPVIFFLDGMFKDFKVDYIPQDYLGTIKERIDLKWLESNLDEVTKSFYNHSLHKKLRSDLDSSIHKIFT